MQLESASGLELKREMVEGQLSRPNQVIPPVMAAIGELLVMNLTLPKKR